MPILYDHARADDLPVLGELFQQAFPEALTAVFNRPHIPPQPLLELLSGLYRYEPDGFFVARRDGRIAGFMMVVKDLGRFYRFLVWSGLLAKIVLKCAANRYGLGFGFIPRLFKAWWEYCAVESPETRKPHTAQVLSIVVDPAQQRQGIGSGLTQRALDYLKTTPAEWVRLEVDAAKSGPITLYKKFGFQTVGTLPSPRGPALIMTRSLKDR